MRLISHWIRRPRSPRFALTLASPLANILGKQLEVEQWQQCFAEVDARNLAATWATVLPVGSVSLATELIGSRTKHELALRLGDRSIMDSLNPLEQRTTVLNNAGLPIRTLVCETPSMHPGVMSRLGASALVSMSADARMSRTGSLRAMAWNQWETPITDRLTTAPSAHRMQQLELRLSEGLKHGWSMHLLCMVGGHPSDDLLRYLDRVAQYEQRGWLKVATAGQVAELASLQVGHPPTANESPRNLQAA